MAAIKWNRIKNEIMKCTDIVSLSKAAYSLEAVQKWAKQIKQSLETQNEIAEYRIRLDRKRGQWINNNIPKEGGEPASQAAKNGRVSLFQRHGQNLFIKTGMVRGSSRAIRIHFKS